MKIETEQLLGSLEVITEPLIGLHDTSYGGYETFCWEVSQKGDFNIFNLILSENFVQAVTPEIVIQNWLKEEQTHSIAPHDRYSIEKPDREKLLDNSTKAYRKEKYQHLLQTLNNNLDSLEGFTIRLSKSKDEDYGCGCFYILIGKTTDNTWVVISSTAPQKYKKIPSWILCSPFQKNDYQQLNISLKIVSDIVEILNELKPLKLAVCYPAGYGYTYDYQLSYAFSVTKSAAFTQALINSRILSIHNFQGFLSGYRRQVLTKFLTTNFSNVIVYHLALYDIDYTYILGQVAGADWLGVRISRMYEYNP
ncbi:hypothetical protein CAL7716_039140 [Calothrix sp. PCC 7716]|nr:hypothetical protein CAL7716_039140 [Calothrix sp. PCC 7716]